VVAANVAAGNAVPKIMVATIALDKTPALDFFIKSFPLQNITITGDNEGMHISSIRI
jgi:hypothetical protein